MIARRAFSALFALLVFLSPPFSASTASAAGKRRVAPPPPTAFLIGSNVFDWECGAQGCWYGRDLGYNGWTDIHLPGYDPTDQFRLEVWVRMLDDLASAGANFVRIPAMTEGQGIRWKPWVNGRIDQIEGADPGWLDHLATLLDLAAARGLRVEIGLLPGNTPWASGKYDFYWAKKLLFNDASTQSDYLNLVVTPLVTRLKDKPAIYSFEALGEADGVFTQDKSISLDAVRSFVSHSAQVIHSLAPGSAVTASTSGYGYNTPSLTRQLLGGLGLDYYSVHIYNDSGKLTDCASWKTLDLPVALEEFGPSDAGGHSDESSLEAYLATITRGFVSQARSCGLLGTALWGANASPGSTGDAATRYSNLYGPGGVAKPAVLSALRN